MPADTTRLFVALRPGEPLESLIRGYKRRLLAAAGPQLYVTDSPHTTVYLAEFAAARVPDVIRAVGQVAGQMEMPAVSIAGWHVFAADPLTGLNTLVCRFDKATCERLRLVQLRVLSAVVPLHDPAATQRALAPRWPALTGEQRRRGMLFGFPYVCGGWIPHLTIASVRESEWPHVGQVFNLSKHDSGQVEYLSHESFTTFDIFELHGLEPVPLASFPLAGRPIGKVA
jgi:2'-5' RNA ligase